MTFKSVALLCICMLFAWIAPAHAAKSYDNCTGYITMAPASINLPGTWCLKQDIKLSSGGGNAINVLADNVTIACNDFAIDGSAGGLGTNAFGVYAEGRRNLTLRNCKVRGFYQGLWVWGDRSGGHRIEDNTFERNTYLGMFVQGDGSVIRRNRVFKTGGSTVYGSSAGIQTSGTVNVIDNTVAGVTGDGSGTQNATGIIVGGAGSIVGNRIRGVVNAAGPEVGVRSDGFMVRAVFRDNEIVGRGREGIIGLYCMNGVSNDRVRNNVVTGFPSAIEDCGGGDGNDVTP
jgi:parallel beta-helix repeat protein